MLCVVGGGQQSVIGVGTGLLPYLQQVDHVLRVDEGGGASGGVHLLLPQLLEGPTSAQPRGQLDLRTYGVGAQILRDLGVRRMKLLGSPRRMPSMAGYGLEVTGFAAAAGAAS